jgi:hypothetical protein
MSAPSAVRVFTTRVGLWARFKRWLEERRRKRVRREVEAEIHRIAQLHWEQGATLNAYVLTPTEWDAMRCSEALGGVNVYESNFGTVYLLHGPASASGEIR